MLVYEAVTQRYGTRVALDGVCLRIGDGERVALVGPSGSGKTTLFRLGYGAFQPTVGRVWVDRVDLAPLGNAQLRAIRARIAVIFQMHGLVDQLRVRDNVIAGTFGQRSTLGALRTLIMPRRDELSAVRAALARVGLLDRIGDTTFGLSGGQRQRVAIARANVQRADLVLADEPVASLDSELAHDIVDLLLDDARERGATLVCALHQAELAAKFDRIVRLEGGRVVADSRPLSVAQAG